MRKWMGNEDERAFWVLLWAFWVLLWSAAVVRPSLWRRLRPQQLPWNITYQLPGQDLPLYLGRALYASHGIATYSVAGGTRSRSITLTAAPP